MEVNRAISAISSAGTVVREMKEILNSFPFNLPTLPPASQRLDQLRTKIDRLEKILPQLVQLIRSYSLIISEAKVAKATSDKAEEIIAQFKAPKYIAFFVNQVENEHGRICTTVAQLPGIDNTEKGKLTQKLSLIRDRIRDLKKESLDDTKIVKRLFGEISTDYTDLQGILSQLLESILRSMELPQS